MRQTKTSFLGRSRVMTLLVLVAFGAACTSAENAHNEPVLLKVPSDPTISFTIWFQVGSQNDPPGKEGLAQLTAQMLSQGSTTENSYEDVLAALYPLASSYSARVDREMITFRGRTHKDNLDRFYALFTDALLRPAFDESDFERLRSDALNEIQNSLRYASDEELGKASFYYSVFEGTPYDHPTVGTVKGLQAITLDDVRSFYRTHFTTGNTVIGLGGGFDDALLDRLQGDLAALPEGPHTEPPAITAARFEGRHVTLVNKPGADASISFGFPIPVRRGERDFYALWLANSWLGEHRNSSSHLYQVIRSARGLNYGDYSYIEAYPQGGFRQMPPTNVARNHQCFEIWIRTLPNDKAVFALRAAMRELENLIDNGMSEEDFELTQKFLDKYILHYAETTMQRLGYAIDDRFYGLDESHLERFRRIVRSLTRDEVNAAIRKHLQADNLQIAIITGEPEMIQEQLVSGAPTPIEYESPKPDAVVQADEQIATLTLDIPSGNVRILPVEQMFED
jgi:zinc protease